MRMRADITLSLAAGLVAALLSHPTPGAEPLYYMWRDDNGVLDFSQQQPADVVTRVVEKPERPFGYPDERAQASSSNGEDSTAADSTTDSESGLPPLQEAGITSTEIQQSNALTMKHNCEAARRVLQRLQGFKQIIVRGEDGFWRELSAEAKQAEIDKTLLDVQEFCGN